MNAKQMFESLGYKYSKDHDDNEIIEYYKFEGTTISFWIREREFIASECCEYPINITVDEFKAIQQQLKELGWLEEEPNQKSNFEYYKNEIKYAGYEFALVNGKPKTCRKSLCDQCYFNDKHFTCARKRIEWMLKPFKRKYKLTQFEYDLLQSYANGYKFKDINPLIVMKEKGYFKDVDKDEKITDILENCEAIE